MKRKVITICCLCIAVTAIVIGIGAQPRTLGNVNRNMKEAATNTSMVSFVAEAGDKIKLSFSSDVKEGTLDITLYDSKGNVVQELDQARELEMIQVLDYDDTYILVADYIDFVGEFQIVAYDITEAGIFYQRCRTS